MNANDLPTSEDTNFPEADSGTLTSVKLAGRAFHSSFYRFALSGLRVMV